MEEIEESQSHFDTMDKGLYGVPSLANWTLVSKGRAAPGGGGSSCQFQ